VSAIDGKRFLKEVMIIMIMITRKLQNIFKIHTLGISPKGLESYLPQVIGRVV
jgi:hypothetical protein